MRLVALTTVLLFSLCGAAAAEDEYLLDEWTCTFDAGRKSSWAHSVIHRTTDEATGGTRYVHSLETWMPVGDDVIHAQSETSTDEAGRILTYELKQSGGRMDLVVEFEDGAYKCTVRKLAPRKGTLDTPVYDADVVALLVRSGRLEAGSRTFHTLNLPGKPGKEQTITFDRTAEGQFRTINKDVTTLRAGDSAFLTKTHADQPYTITRAATEANAADRSIRDRETTPEETPIVLRGASLQMTVPKGEYRITHDSSSKMADILAVTHVTGPGVMAMELQLPIRPGADALMKTASGLGRSMSEKGTVQHSEPTLGTFRGREAAVMTIRGDMDMEPVTGTAWVLRSKAGSTIYVMTAHATDQAEWGKPLADEALKGLVLDAARPKWKTHELGAPLGATLELPSSWKAVTPRPGQYGFLSPNHISRVSVFPGRYPNDEVGAQQVVDAWVENIKAHRNSVRVEDLGTTEIEVDGRKAVRRATRMPLGVDGPNGESLILYGVNLILDRPDGRYVQFMIVLLVDGREEKTIERILKSVRWNKTDK